MNTLIYFVMKESTAAMINDLGSAHPSVQLLEWYFRETVKIVENGANGKGDDRGRYKLIASLDSIPKIISSFNNTPALITDDGRLYVNTNNITMDININDWVYFVRQSLYNFGGLDDKEGGSLGKSRIKIATLVEPRENEHYDERILGVIQISRIHYKEVAVEWTGNVGWKVRVSRASPPLCFHTLL